MKAALAALLTIWVSLVIVYGAAATVTVAVPAGIDKPEARLVLHIENLRLPKGASGMIRVFADLPDADASTSVDDEHYLGYFAVVPKNSAEAANGIERAAVTWDLTGRRMKLADKKEVTLSIVPLNNGSTDDRPVFSRAYLARN